MGQRGFFDLEGRLATLDDFGDPLTKVEDAANFGGFRSALDKALPSRARAVLDVRTTTIS